MFPTKHQTKASGWDILLTFCYGMWAPADCAEVTEAADTLHQWPWTPRSSDGVIERAIGSAIRRCHEMVHTPATGRQFGSLRIMMCAQEKVRGEDLVYTIYYDTLGTQ